MVITIMTPTCVFIHEISLEAPLPLHVLMYISSLLGCLGATVVIHFTAEFLTFTNISQPLPWDVYFIIYNAKKYLDINTILK
jgi:hypothetical protein